MTSIIGSAFSMLISGVIGGFSAIAIEDLLSGLNKKFNWRSVRVFIIKILIVFIAAILLIWWVSKTYGSLN
jgi:hypothetical protein